MRASLFLLSTCALFLFTGCSKSERVVVVYTSQDQVYAEPILAQFTQETGIKVLPLFDSESVKTAGLVQRLFAEKNNPRADIFWSNEEMLYRQLVDANIIDSNRWARLGCRERRLVFNTNYLSEADSPKSLLEFTNAKWSGKIAVAYPLYGTTAAHMVALREVWGDAKWSQWCDALVANKPFIVDGNSLVVKLVGAGEAWIGLTDSDDFAAGLRNKLPIASAHVTDEFLRIPNSVGILNGAPHSEEANAFFAFIQSEKVLNELVKVSALEKAVCDGAGLSDQVPVQETLDRIKTIFKR